VNGETLFSVPGVLSFSAAARAAAIEKRIEDLSKNLDPRIRLTVFDLDGISHITAGDLIVMSVTDPDAKTAGKDRQTLARDYAQRIDTALIAYRHQYSLESLIVGGIYALLSTIVLIIALRLIGILFRKLYKKIHSWRGTRIRSLRIQKFELLPANRIADFAIGVAKVIRLAGVLVLLYSYASLVLGLFPWTRGYAHVLFGYVLAPLTILGRALADYLPNAFFIAVIVLISFYVIKLFRIIFAEIGKETITLPDFYPEWAEPTYKIVRLLIIAMTVIIVFPYVPGSKSPAFRGISIFIGVLLSFGSTSAVANLVSGVILTYMRAFRIGDRVKIADTEGDVMEKTLLVTRVRTIKNVDVTITNSMVLNSHVINFSTSAKQDGLILNTSVTIGYDAPWRTVHKLLIDAALECKTILNEPKPFVLQTALDDFYVHYEINAYTDQPQEMATTYSELHEKIQDKFNQAGVEIMSSHYANVRDGNRTTIPIENLPSEYVAPPFNIRLKEQSEKPVKPADRV
jgi:small-conductance mechanosensitive channel